MVALHFYNQVIRVASHLENRLRHTNDKKLGSRQDIYSTCVDSLSLCCQIGLRRQRFCSTLVPWDKRVGPSLLSDLLTFRVTTAPGVLGQHMAKLVLAKPVLCLITDCEVKLRSGFCYGNETKLFSSWMVHKAELSGNSLETASVGNTVSAWLFMHYCSELPQL